jgi:hypothetical protein
MTSIHNRVRLSSQKQRHGRRCDIPRRSPVHNLVLEPVHETGMTPLKFFTTQMLPYPLAFEVDTINWSIIAVSKIFILQMGLFRTVTACRWQIFLDVFERGV